MLPCGPRQARKGAAAADLACVNLRLMRSPTSTKNETMTYQVLARKWRPKTFAETTGQTHVLQALTNALKQERLHHAYLFTGTRGVGKTTIARILAKCLNCETGITPTPCGECGTCQEIDTGRFIDLIEVDAASRTKVEDTRELLDNVQYSPSKGRFKVYLIDEVHMLSGHSFNALLKTLEEPPAHVKFLLATTDPQKLPETVLSRCLQFHLKNLLPEQIVEQLQHILTQEKISFELPALHLIGNAAKGSLRDALSLLDQAIALSDGNVNAESVKLMLGTIEDSYLVELVTALIQQDANALFQTIENLADRTNDFNEVVDNLISFLHHLAITQAIPDALPASWGEPEQLKSLASQLTAEALQLYYQIALLGRRDLPYSPDPKSGFQMVMLRMLAFTPREQPIRANAVAFNPAPAKTVQTAPALQTKKSSVATTAPPSSGNFPAWENLIPLLKLSGSTYVLAQHCALANAEGNTVQLLLDPSHKPLLNEKVKARLNEALSEYFGKPITVQVDIAEKSIVTPAAKELAKQEAKQKAAVRAIEQDANVKALIEAFDATVIPDTVTGIE